MDSSVLDSGAGSRPVNSNCSSEARFCSIQSYTRDLKSAAYSTRSVATISASSLLSSPVFS